MSIDKPWIISKEKTLLSCKPWLEVTEQQVTLPNGKVVDDYFQIYASSYVEIIPVLTNGSILMAGRYKHGPRSYSLGFPGGYIEPGEPPIDTARRELQEECGLVSDDWREMVTLTIDGNRGPSSVSIFLAYQCREGQKLESDDLEDTTLIEVTVDKLKANINTGQIKTLGAYCAALLAVNEVA